MLRLFKLSLYVVICINFISCEGQVPIGQHTELSDEFDDSQPFYYKIPTTLSSIDTCSGWQQNGQKILLTGTVLQEDGKTPASGIILYYYHTDIHGKYVSKKSENRNMPINKSGQTHGYMRGWIKTDGDGKYSIYTVKPASYPNRLEPAHIHVSVKDKNISEPYYIDNYVFDDDPLLTSQLRKNRENRGGSGVIRFVQKENLLIGERNIYLGLNIPDYPESNAKKSESGKNVGEDILSFTPFHAFGVDKGSKACPICKYGWYHGILYFAGNNPNWSQTKEWLNFLDSESEKRDDYLKVYFVYGNETDYIKENRESQLEKLGEELDLKKVALTFVPSFSDIASEIYLNEIDPNVENTILIYKRSIIIEKHINLKPSNENFNKISNRLDLSKNEYFKLPKLKQN